MSKRRHNFGTKRFKEKSLFIFHARIALKSLILLFVRLIVRGARIGKTHTQTHSQRTSSVTLAHARRGLINMRVYITSAHGHELSGRVRAHAYNYYALSECAWVAK